MGCNKTVRSKNTANTNLYSLYTDIKFEVTLISHLVVNR